MSQLLAPFRVGSESRRRGAHSSNYD